MISSVLVSLIFKDIRPVSFILSQRSISDTSSLTGSMSFKLSQFAISGFSTFVVANGLTRQYFEEHDVTSPVTTP